MKQRGRRFWKKALSVSLVLTVLASTLPGALAIDLPFPGGDNDWQSGAGLGNADVNKAPRNYDHAVITGVTAIKDVKTEANANELNYYIVGATVTNEDGEKACTGLVTVLDSAGKEIAPAITEADGVVSVTYDGISPDAPGTVVITDYIQGVVNKEVDEKAGDYLAAMGTEGTSPDMAYRAALYINDGVQDENSITEAIQGKGALAGTTLDGAKIEAASSGFSGVIVKTSEDVEAASEVTISNSTIKLESESDGTDVNDFAGYGAAVGSFGDDTLTVIEDSTISTGGVAKTAVFTDTGANLVVKNSTLSSSGGTIYEDYELTSATNKMVAPPWVLGVAGSARTSNLMGQGSTATFVDSTITADSWGALSVDNGNDMVMTTVNSNVDTTKVDGDSSKVNGAYGAFGIGSTQEYMFGLDMDVDNYAWVMLGAAVNLNRSETGKEYEIKNTAGESVTTVTSDADGRNSTIDSGNFGFMMSAFGGSVNTVNVGEGTEINTENAVFLYKSGDAVVNIDNAAVSAENGVLFQAIDNEDSIVGDMTKGFSEPAGWSSTWYEGEDYQGQFKSSGNTGDITINDSTIEGDIYNGTGYFYTAGGMFVEKGIFGAHTLNVSLTGSTSLSGVIASTEIQHGDWNNDGSCTLNKTINFRDSADASYDVARATQGAMKLGHVINQNYFNGCNKVNVTVADGAKWNVTGDSLVYDLVANSDDITAGEAVTITVKGTLLLDGQKVTGEKTVGNVTYKAEAEDDAVLSVQGLLTLTVNGAEVPLDTEIREDDEAVLTVTNYLQADGETVGKLSGAANGTGRPYRPAVFVDDGAYDADKSVAAAVQDNGGTASVTDDALSNVSVSGGSTGFSGIILNEAGEYVISDSKVVLDTASDGSDANDFSGYGSAVAIFGDTRATIENTEIETAGVAISGVVTDGGADVVVKGSTITTNGGTIYENYEQTSATDTMIAPPWDLGLTGSVRAVNVMGTEGTFTIVDSTINADSWAGISTDGADKLHVTGINSDINVEDSGYGILSIGGGTQFDLYGTDIDTETFIGVYMDASTINISGSEAKTYVVYSMEAGDADEDHAASQLNMEDKVAEIDNDEAREAVLTSDLYGFMFNIMMGSGSKTNYLNLGKDVSIHTGKTTFLAKSDGAKIVVDGAAIEADSGVILQAMDNPGSAIGMDMSTNKFIRTYEEEEGWSSTWEEARQVTHGKRSPTDLTLKNTDIEGDIYNSTGYRTSAQGGGAVNVTIGEGASLNGVLASTEFKHVKDDGTQNAAITYWDDGYDYEQVKQAAHALNQVANQNYFNGYNDVNVSVTDDGLWIVAGDSMVTDVTLADESSVRASAPVTVTVYGTLTVSGQAFTYAEGGKNSKTIGNVTFNLVENTLTGEPVGEGGVPGGFPGGEGGVPGGGFPGYNPPEAGATIEDPGYTHMVLEHVSAVEVTNCIDNVNGLSMEDAGVDNRTPVAANVTLSATSQAMLTTSLYRMAGEPAVTGSASFTDVADGQWYTNAVIWASQQGIVQGIGNGKFDPNGVITREQLAVMFYRYVGGQPVSADMSRFQDSASISDWALEAINWAVAQGIITGNDQRYLAPGSVVARAEVDQLLLNFSQLT